MSLRLRILLLIAAVNVAVLLLVVWVGLRTAERDNPLRPEALLEALRLVHSDAPAERAWNDVSFIVRVSRAGETQRFAPAGLEELSLRAEERVRSILGRGESVFEYTNEGLLVHTADSGARYPGYFVGFNERAGWKALAGVRRVYIVLCAGTVLLILGTYLVLRILVLGPLGQLAEASRAVAEGRSPGAVPRPRGNDEMAGLVDDFNRMAQEVHEYQERLEERVLSTLARVSAAETRLVVAQRLAATGTLAAGFAHEINNPVGGILNAVRKLQAGGLPDERREEYFALVLDGVDRIRTIVQRILHFTPREREPASLDLADICHRAADLARHRGEQRGIAVDLDIQEPLPAVVGDFQELTQALLNLVLNAVDAIPAERAGRVVVRARQEQQEAILEVSDDGPGMDEETVRRCVDLFFSTKPEGQGTGLGLAIVQHIVTDHGGTLDIESREGEGTTVRMRLPIEEGR